MCAQSYKPDSTSVRPLFRVLAAIVSTLFILGLIRAIDVKYFNAWWYWLIWAIYIVVSGIFLRAALIGKGPKWLASNLEPTPTSVRPVFGILGSIASILSIWGLARAMAVNDFIGWYWFFLVIWVVVFAVMAGILLRAALTGKGPKWLVPDHNSKK